MLARDSVDTLFHSKTSLYSVSLTTRPRRHWGLKSAKGDSRSLRSRESPPNLNIKGTSDERKNLNNGWGSVSPGGVCTGSSGSFQKTGSSVVHWGAAAAVTTYPRETLASLAVQRRVLARKRVLSLDEIWHPLRRFVEKRVRGGPWFQNSFRDRRLLFFMPNARNAYSLKIASWDNSKRF